jgi:anaerobic nitric oxide reductase transcription regulator
MADNGTLFLDEIGELSLALQAKLLRVLQYGDIQRVGDDRSLRVDVRVLAATNRDLRQEVVEGRFRADLYHRLSVFPLSVPALRERDQDVVLLAGYFCEQCRLRMGLGQVVLSSAARARLGAWPWPGNVRELEHAIHRAVVLARATQAGDDIVLAPQHFQFAGEAPNLPSAAPLVPTQAINLREATEAFQREAIARALAENNRSWAAAARALAMDVANLHRLAKRLGLKESRPDKSSAG